MIPVGDGVLSVQAIECFVAPYEWPFARSARGRIAGHWAALTQKQPALYNGRVLLARDLHLAGENPGVLKGLAFETDFADFLAWRDFGFPDPDVRNCFSMAALRSADGAWLLGAMGDHTANAGKIYFPAGTPDRDDIRAGMIDFEGSAVRELREETGLDAAAMRVVEDWSVVVQGPRIGCMKIIESNEDAAPLCAAIATFLSSQRQPELRGMHIVRTRDDLVPARMPAFLLRWLEDRLP